MTNAGHIQKKMSEMQNSEAISEVFGKLVSGRAGYNAVIEVSKPSQKCCQCS